MSPPRIRLPTGTTYSLIVAFWETFIDGCEKTVPTTLSTFSLTKTSDTGWEPEVSQFFWNQGQALNRSPRSTGKLRHCHGKHISQQGSSIRKWVKDLSRNLRPKSNYWLPAIPAMNYHSDSLSKIRSGICMIETYVEHLRGHAFY